MRFSNVLRYGLWLGLLATADANRREYKGMTTPWLPHLVLNTLILLLPDLYHLLPQPGDGRSMAEQTYRLAHDLIGAAAEDNPDYAEYIAPVTIGYLLSHPRFDIYKGDLGKIRILGFGLDAIPHGLAGYTLTRLTRRTTYYAARRIGPDTWIGKLLRWGDRHPVLLTLMALSAATTLWEGEEYAVHNYELAQRDNDPTKINMQWDIEDTERDAAANIIGWALGILAELRSKKYPMRSEPEG
ncbi:MAG TPA: hypothetical protein VMT34_05605 [Aggregatilineales bacterium]|nr:hypothetical protein [Aggregatilineales bacterium]